MKRPLGWIKAWWRAGPLGRTDLRVGIDEEGCPGCGERSFEQRQIIRDHLAESWELSPAERQWFDQREGNFCRGCGMSRRVRMLAWTLRFFPRLKELSILHLNEVNQLSPLLGAARALVETTHQPGQPWGAEIGRLSNQNLEALTFDAETFDLVVHSETLEHVFDCRRALAEIHRVLKPGGYQLYSVPVLHRRKTRQRLAKAASGKVIHLLPPSYHGLDREFPVAWELGGDFIQSRRGLIQGVYYDRFWRNPTVFSILERKTPAGPAPGAPNPLRSESRPSGGSRP
ncbi:MAG TPA: methyltransferase domain-containing protein [Thermoanaerobaculia bacterium]|nr:methyltransferase domain-containing protein [Thermoanaerobaculia bacterium]